MARLAVSLAVAPCLRSLDVSKNKLGERGGLGLGVLIAQTRGLEQVSWLAETGRSRVGPARSP